MDLMIGTFIVKGKMRISTRADPSAAIEVARTARLFVYNAHVSNPYLPQMPVMHVPMLFISRLHGRFGR